jgi:segregation and condensation protein B
VSNDERSEETLAAQAAAWVPPWERQQRPPDRAYQSAAEAAARAQSDERPDDDEDRSAAGLSDDDDDFDPAFEGANPPGYYRPGAGADENQDDPESVDGLGESGAVGRHRSSADADENDADQSDADDGDTDESGAGDASESGAGARESGVGDAGESGAGDGDADEGGDGDADRGDGGASGGYLGEVEEEAALGGGEEPPVSVDAPVDFEDGELDPQPTSAEVGPELAIPGAIEEAVDDHADSVGQAADAPWPADGDDAGDVFDQAADDDVSDDGADDLPIAGVEPVDNDDYDGDGDADERDGADSDADGSDGADSVGDGSDGGDSESGDSYGDGGDGGDLAISGDESAENDGSGSGAGAFEAGAGAVAAPRAGAVPEQGRGRRGGSEIVGGGDARTSEDLPELTDDSEFAAALEAILLVVDEPVAEMQLAQILEQPTERVGAMLEDISARYTAAGHGFDLRRAAGGWRLYTRPEYAAYVERFVLDGQSVRLTQAALETLAVVAYKQPVTRSRISAIRGVNCDGVMRTLATRGLIEECGTEGETGAYLYRTTALFLEKLGLNSVDQLPPLAPFLPDDVEEVLDASG